MLNLAGPAYDFGPVLFAVLQECEHQRPALPPEGVGDRFREIARGKLDAIRRSYDESGGDPDYWRDLEREVFTTALPQYTLAAAEQTRLERSRYGLWRGGDPLARGAMGAGGLGLAALVFRLPLPPLVESPVMLALAAAGFLYPEIKRWATDRRHARFLNRLIGQAEAYQKDRRLHYVPHSRYDAALRTLATREVAEEAAAAEDSTPEPSTPKPSRKTLA